MRSLRRLLVMAVLVSGVTVGLPAAADDPQSLPYFCDASGAFPDATPAMPGISSESADPLRIYEPATWTIRIAAPAFTPATNADADRFELRFPVPAGIEVQSVTLVAAPATTPNPPLDDLDVTVQAHAILVELPAVQDTAHRIRFAQTSGAMTYPQTEGSGVTTGTPVVLPDLVVTGVALPQAGGRRVLWESPEFVTAFPALSVSFDCLPKPTSIILGTSVSTTRQTCLGQPVSVQLGVSGPTAGADVIQGTPSGDTTNGLGGTDRFCGLDGNDTFNGGPGGDRARGGSGNDRLRGDDGADALEGQEGNDTLTGGRQRDTCNGGPGTDSAATCEVRQSIP